MSRIRLLLAVLTLLALPPRASAEVRPAQGLSERSFRIEHRPLDEAYRLVSPLLSERSEIRVVRGANRIDVRDEPARLEDVARALVAFDVAARSVHFGVRVVRGEKRDRPAVTAANAVPPDVREALAYNTFETIGRLDVELAEGGQASGYVGDDEHLRIAIELGAVNKQLGTIQVRSLRLERKLRGAAGAMVYVPVFQFSEELQSGRSRVVGFASPASSERRALFLLLTAVVD